MKKYIYTLLWCFYAANSFSAANEAVNEKEGGRRPSASSRVASSASASSASASSADDEEGNPLKPILDKCKTCAVELRFLRPEERKLLEAFMTRLKAVPGKIGEDELEKLKEEFRSNRLLSLKTLKSSEKFAKALFTNAFAFAPFPPDEEFDKNLKLLERSVAYIFTTTKKVIKKEADGEKLFEKAMDLYGRFLTRVKTDDFPKKSITEKVFIPRIEDHIENLANAVLVAPLRVLDSSHLPMLNALRGYFKDKGEGSVTFGTSRLDAWSLAYLNLATRFYNQKRGVGVGELGILEILFGKQH